MNRKGFAISIILYAVVFLIIAMLYLILGIVKARYNTNDKLRENIVDKLNGDAYLYNKLND